MPKINYLSSYFTTVNKADLITTIANLEYLLEGRIDDDNLLRVKDTGATPQIERVVPLPTKRVMDYADDKNPVADCMKLFGTGDDPANPAGVKELVFDPLKTFMESNHVYATDSRTVAWSFTKESSDDKTESQTVALQILNPVLPTKEKVIRKSAEKVIRESSIYKKSVRFEKPRNWIPVPAENTDTDIDNIYTSYNNKIKYTVEFRTDRMLNTTNDQPQPFEIIINEPSVSDDEVVFDVDVIAVGLKDEEYINIEVTITVMYEIVP